MQWILRTFVRDHANVTDPAVRQRCGTLGSIVGIGLNIVLFIIKLAVGVMSGAVSALADAFNNLSDAASSVVTLVGFRMAGKPADREHPFGHGRIEYIAGLFVAVVILLVGVELLETSFNKILQPEEVVFSWLSVAILAVTALTKLWMGRFSRFLGRHIDSLPMMAAGTDSTNDAIATGAVIAGMLVARFAGLAVDGYVGCAVALFILYSGVNALRDTLQPLLGQAPEDELVRRIEETVLSYPEIVGVHDLVVHNYGPGRSMISLHAEVSCDADIQEIHDIIDLAEIHLKEKFDSVAVIHMDPIVTNDTATNTMRQKTAAMVQVIDPELTIHDFRMTEGPALRNLIFDVTVPFGFRLSDEELIDAIRRAMRTLDEKNNVVVRIDKVGFRGE